MVNHIDIDWNYSSSKAICWLPLEESSDQLTIFKASRLSFCRGRRAVGKSMAGSNYFQPVQAMTSLGDKKSGTKSLHHTSIPNENTEAS